MNALRRDRMLFALVACLTLIVTSLQPLASARASTMSGLAIICSAHQVVPDRSDDGRPAHSPGSGCPCCIGGVCPAVTGPAKAIFDGGPGDWLERADASVSVDFGVGAVSLSSPPPRYPAPIRAPPPAA